MPSVGWEFDEGENPWRTINISVDEDAVAGTEVTFEHEVWDHDSNCPVHNVGRLTVRIVEERPAEPLPELSIRDASRVTEGDAASFEVRISKASDRPVTVRYETEGGTALEDTDFDRASGTLRFEPNDRVKTVQVQTTNDALDEPDENFAVKLSSPSGATLNDATATGTIRDNDDTPKLSIGDATVAEGGTAEFEVTLDSPSGQDVTVRVRTRNGTARSDSDYGAVDTTLTFPAGETRKTIDVQTTRDEDYEADEDFTVRLSSPRGATIEDGTGDGTITNDDSPPQLSIDDATVEEGQTATFEVTLTGERSVTATVRYSTMDGSAVEGSDYTAIDGGTLTFRPGDDSETIRVSTREDSAREDTETFTVVLSEPQEATIQTGTGTGTINDDDAGALPSLRIVDATVTEGGTASFEVTLSATSTETVTVAYETRDVTARGGDDYTAVTTPATLTFTPQDLSETITVATLHDQDYEGDEAFEVRLSSPSMATIDRGTATGTIQDNDDPGLSINDVTVREGGAARFTVRLEGPTDHAVTVTATTSDGTAVAGEDYTTKSQSLIIPARETTATFSVDTLADEVPDSNETFTVTLSNPSGRNPHRRHRHRYDHRRWWRRRRRWQWRRRRRWQWRRRWRWRWRWRRGWGRGRRWRRKRPPLPVYRGRGTGNRGGHSRVRGDIERGERAGSYRGVRDGGRDGEGGLGLHADHREAAVRAGRHHAGRSGFRCSTTRSWRTPRASR